MHAMRKVLAIILFVFLIALLIPFVGTQPAQAESWENILPDGFGDSYQCVGSMAVNNGSLYVGTKNTFYKHIDVWEYRDGSWYETNDAAFNSYESVSSMTTYKSLVYAGTGKSRVLKYDGSEWTCINTDGFGSAGNVYATSMTEFNNNLYVGTYNNYTGAEVWRYNGSSWSQVNSDGFGTSYNISVDSMAPLSGYLYAGIRNETDGCEVWRSDGSTWSKVYDGGFGNRDNVSVSSMAAYDGNLYAGTSRAANKGGCEVWRYNGSTWAKVNSDGFGNEHNDTASSMAVFKDYLYIGAGQGSSSSEIWRYNGSSWMQAASSNEIPGQVSALASDTQDLYAGVSCIAFEGSQVLRTSSPGDKVYFAEGCTRTGFQEWLCLGNSGDEQITATITYLFSDGQTQQEEVIVPPKSRNTVDVNTAVGADKDVSVIISSHQTLIAERPIYFTYQGQWTGGHDAIAATAPSTEWYFAEGYTGSGFDQWVCVLNPGNTTANLEFHFQTEEVGPRDVTGLSVPPRTRASFKVNDILGPDLQNSLKLESDQPVVAERPMYYNYQGLGAHGWDGGHCVMGTTKLRNMYYFAEGTTRAGFEEWLTLQNPNDEDIVVSAYYQLETGELPAIDHTVPANSRKTIYVPDDVGLEHDVSVYLRCGDPVYGDHFLAERPMYFNYSYKDVSAQGGDCVIGSTTMGMAWFFAEGYTGPGYNEWLCIQNPTDRDAIVTITYYTQEMGELPSTTLEIPAGSRETVMVNEEAGSNYQLSTLVEVESSAVVVERPMFFNYGGCNGGHDVVGQRS